MDDFGRAVFARLDSPRDLVAPGQIRGKARARVISHLTRKKRGGGGSLRESKKRVTLGEDGEALLAGWSATQREEWRAKPPGYQDP